MTSFSSVHICIAFRLLRRGNMKLHALLGHPVSENFVSWCQTLKNSSASFLCIQETETRQFGTKTFRNPLKKTVRHQDISAPRKFGIKTNRHRIFFQTNVITFFKIKSTEVKKNPSMIV